MASQILLNVTGKQMCNSKLLQVPTQKAAYAAIQNSLIHSKAADERNSVSAMSGVSSASGGSILGPLPEEDTGPVPASGRGCPPAPSPALLRRPRCSSMSSPASSPIRSQIRAAVRSAAFSAAAKTIQKFQLNKNEATSIQKAC